VNGRKGRARIMRRLQAERARRMVADGLDPRSAADRAEFTRRICKRVLDADRVRAQAGQVRS
jgi:hypothetical protein